MQRPLTPSLQLGVFQELNRSQRVHIMQNLPYTCSSHTKATSVQISERPYQWQTQEISSTTMESRPYHMSVAVVHNCTNNKVKVYLEASDLAYVSETLWSRRADYIQSLVHTLKAHDLNWMKGTWSGELTAQDVQQLRAQCNAIHATYHAQK